jgi:pilus assembly protein CpaF
LYVDRISSRANIRKDDVENIYISTYEVIEEITNEVVKENKELVNEITLGNIPETALENKIIKIINRHNYKVIGNTRKDIIKDTLDNIFGYGNLQKYLEKEGCNGIFINGPNNCWKQIGNKRTVIEENFGNNKNLVSYIRSIAAKLGGEINENKPLTRFFDTYNKLRIVACLNPVSHLSPTLVFRKHRDENFTLNELIDLEMLTHKLANDLKAYNEVGANIVICGKGGSGKTTLARALTEELPKDTRILLMEEHPEWFLKHKGALQYLVKRNERGHVTNLAELTDYGLLMTIDRYIFGEIRGAEAMPFFKGALSGNTTMTTTHACSSRDLIDMLMINMKMSGTDISSDVLKEILFNSINIIIFMDSFTVMEVVEIVKEDEDKFNDLWKFDIKNKEVTFIEGEHKKVNEIKSKSLLGKINDLNLRKEEDSN